MKRKNKKNADSFLMVSSIEKGEVTGKYKLPLNSFEKFSLSKTNVLDLDFKDVFVIKKEAGEVFRNKILRK